MIGNIMIKPYVLITLLTEKETMDWSLGEEFLGSFNRLDKRLEPEFYSNAEEKINAKFSGVADCEGFWAPLAKANFEGKKFTYPLNFCWKRKRVAKSEGVVSHTRRVGPKNRKQLGRVKLKISPVRGDINYLEVLQEWCKIFEASFGMLHLFTEPELGPAKFKSPENKFRLGPVGRVLQEDGIPNLAWATYFGDNLANEVDVQALQNMGVAVEGIANGYLIQTTNDLFDVEKNYSEFEKARSEIKSTFKEEVFLIS